MSTEFGRKEKVLFSLYGSKEYEEAFSMAERLIKEYPSKGSILYNYAYSIKSLMGDADGALRLMEEAVEKGYWSDPKRLEADSDLKSLQGDTRFTHVLELNAKLAEEGRKKASPVLKIIEPEAGGKAEKPLPLLIALHGNTQSAEDAAEEWKFMAEKGWLVGVPQSSQELIAGGYVWNDFIKAIPEVKSHLEQIEKNHNIDKGKIVVAGFSMGGALAAKMCIEQLIPCRKFILVGPYIKEPSGFAPAIRAFAPGGGRGYVLVGENDSECLDGARNLYELLKSNGVDCRLNVLKNLAHEYPDDFPSHAEAILKFLLD